LEEREGKWRREAREGERGRKGERRGTEGSGKEEGCPRD